MLTKVLKILRKISEIIAAHENHQSVLDEIVVILAQNLEVDVCSIYTHDASAGELVLTATCGLEKASVGNVRLGVGEGITGLSFQEMEIINVADAATHPRYRHFQGIGEEKYKSFMSVPLVIGGRCTGVLNLQRVRSARFSPAVVDMVTSLSTQLANLVLNARMLEELASGKADREEKEEPQISSQVMLRGVSANAGISHGRAIFFERQDYLEEIKPANNMSATHELLLLEHALKQAKKETVELENRAMQMISEADASIFNVHLLFLEDKTLLDAIRGHIEKDRYTIEYSIRLLHDDYQERFSRLSDAVFREKAADLKDVLLRLLKIVSLLRGSSDVAKTGDAAALFDGDQILFTRELLPSDLIRMPLDRIAGIVCEKGGITAHVAVLAKALDIPALLGVRDVMTQVREGDEVILDGFAELIYLRPQAQVRRHFREVIGAVKREVEPDAAAACLTDGDEIILRSNISLVSETSLIRRYGARGVGLYRSEFLFMIRDYLPDEDTQYRVFSRIIKEAGGEDVSIRALDVGADKPLSYIDFPHEDNPALGWRGIRILLDRRDILKTHLRAMLRAGTNGRLKILFPMVSSSEEVIQLRQVLTEVETELHAKDIEHTEDYLVGAMIEVPSAVIGLCTILKYVDYISIGSNDLLQYTFAIDRGNEKVADSYQCFHPVFLAMLGQIAKTVRAVPEKSLAICGEMAGNPRAVPLLIGLGIEDLSMAPKQIPAVKQVIRKFSRDECRKLAGDAMLLESPEAVSCLINQAFQDKGLSEPHLRS